MALKGTFMATKAIQPDPPLPPGNNVDFSLIPKMGTGRLQVAEPRPEALESTPRQGRGARLPKGQLTTSLDQHIEKLKARTRKATDEQRTALDIKVLQEVLPLWDDANRGVPNPFIRSGLFSVKTTVERQYLDNIHIDSLSNYEVRYEGKELQQDDLTVWMSLINLAKNQPVADKVFFTGYELIKDMGWRMHSETYEKIKQSIQRLKVTGIQIATANNSQAYSGSLIRDFGWAERDPVTGNAKWMVRFEPTVSALFMDDTTTLLEWQTRKKIGTRATVALWLHAFYSSHRDPIPLPLSKLHELSRSAASLSTFRRNVKNALQTLIEVDFLTSFEVKNDTVYVTKKLRPKAIRKS